MDAPQPHGAQLTSVQVAIETSHRQVAKRKPRVPSKLPAKKRKVSKHFIDEEVVSETEDERQTGFLYPCVREHRSSGSIDLPLLKVKEQDALGENGSRHEDAKVPLSKQSPAKRPYSPPKMGVDAKGGVKQSQDFDHQDTPHKLKLDLSKFIHTSTAPAPGPSFALAKRTQSTPAACVTPETAKSHAPRRAVSAASPAAGPSTACKAKQKAKADLSSKPIRQNEPIHPFSLELSSIEDSKFKCLIKCPLCMRRFPASHTPQVKSRHIGSCAAERNAIEVVVAQLIDMETDLLLRAEVKKRRQDEENLTVYSRVMAPLERQKGKKAMKDAVFTTLKPARVGQRGARQAMKELFASPLLNKVPRRLKSSSASAADIDQGKGKRRKNKEDFEQMEMAGSTAQRADSEERKSQRSQKKERDLLSLYDFELTEEQDYTLGMLPTIGSQRPIVSPSLTYASQLSMAVIQGHSTQGTGLAAAAAGSFGISKLATKQLCTRSRLGLGIGCLAGRTFPGPHGEAEALGTGNEDAQGDFASWMRPMTAASADVGLGNASVRAVESRADDETLRECPVGSASRTTEGPADNLLKSRTPEARTILPEPSQQQDDIGERAVSPLSWRDMQQDVDLFDLVAIESRVLVPCSQ